MCVFNRVGRSLTFAARLLRYRAQWSGVRPLWPRRNGGKKSVMAYSSITTRMRKIAPRALHIRYARFPMRVFRPPCTGTRFPTVTRLTLRYSRCRSVSRKSAIRMRTWMPSLVRWKNYSSLLIEMTQPVSAMRHGLRTFARWKRKDLEWRHPALKPQSRSNGPRCRSLSLRTLPIRQLPWQGLKGGSRNILRSPVSSRQTMCWSTPCAAGPRRGPESGLTCVTCLRQSVRRKQLPTLTMTRLVSGANGARKNQRRVSERRKARLNGHVERSLPALAEERPLAGHTCSRPASCRTAICETARYDESGYPACGRKRPLQPVPDAALPTTNPCLDSNGSGRPACALRPRRSRFLAPPNVPKGGRRPHQCGMD